MSGPKVDDLLKVSAMTEDMAEILKALKADKTLEAECVSSANSSVKVGDDAKAVGGVGKKILAKIGNAAMGFAFYLIAKLDEKQAKDSAKERAAKEIEQARKDGVEVIK